MFDLVVMQAEKQFVGQFLNIRFIFVKGLYKLVNCISKVSNYGVCVRVYILYFSKTAISAAIRNLYPDKSFERTLFNSL